MKINLLACLRVALLLALPSVALGADPWSLAVVQGAKSVKAEGAVRLEKKPFSLVFSGPQGMAYALLVSVACPEMEALKDEASIAEKIRPTNIAAERRGRENRGLVINNTGAVASDDNTANLWGEDPKAGMTSFQTYLRGNGGGAVATREISEMGLYTSYKEDSVLFKIESIPFDKACFVVTGLPPTGRMTHTGPKHFSITFR